MQSVRSVAYGQTTSSKEDNFAVSEVLGVVMLLAMIMTIMGGVFVFLQPYINDFEDASNWNSAMGMADKIEDRIEVAAQSPNGSGIRNTFTMTTSSIYEIERIETWTVAADLVQTDSTIVSEDNSTIFKIESTNETARSIMIQSPEGIITEQLSGIGGTHLISHQLYSDHWMVVDVFDANGQAIHRWFRWHLSGLEIVTEQGNGEFRIALVNHGRIEHFPNGAWDVERVPSLEVDELAEGGIRLSIVLTDVAVEGGIGTGSQPLDFVSQGIRSMFHGEAYNVRFTMKNEFNPIVTPLYHETWLEDYTLNRASGTLDQHIGISPYLRASGSDGFTVSTQGQALHFNVDVQHLEVTS